MLSSETADWNYDSWHQQVRHAVNASLHTWPSSGTWQTTGQQLQPLARVQTGKPYACHQCRKSFQTQMGLKHHLQSHKGKTFMCPVCDSKFTQKFSIKTHLRGKHGSAQCFTCSGIFKLGEDYNSHLKTCH